MKKLLIAISALLVAVFAEAGDIKIVTEDFPPYNYEENGKITGLSTKVVRAVLKELGMNPGIRIYPWARAYKMASEQENVLIYSILRTAEREKLFRWVGKIAVSEMYLFRLNERNDIKINSLGDAKKYTVGVTRETAPHQYLSERGFDLKEVVSRDDLNIRKLVRGRIDLMPYYEAPFLHKVRNLGYDPGKFEKAYFMNDASEELYMAFSNNTSDKIVEKFAKALERIKTDGTYDKIVKEYFSD
ncbi:transporter substrate-binding domain-containing protein [Desulfococcaceae bacterium HSG8]|nr:transporter substrate-binding domain-containing protein [Desulfococcaceae bacterium HSG8]